MCQLLLKEQIDLKNIFKNVKIIYKNIQNIKISYKYTNIFIKLLLLIKVYNIVIKY